MAGLIYDCLRRLVMSVSRIIINPTTSVNWELHGRGEKFHIVGFKIALTVPL